jgi:hypothetical protein
MSESRFQYSFQSHFPAAPNFVPTIDENLRSKIAEILTGYGTGRLNERMRVSGIYRRGRESPNLKENSRHSPQTLNE